MPFEAAGKTTLMIVRQHQNTEFIQNMSPTRNGILREKKSIPHVLLLERVK